MQQLNFLRSLVKNFWAKGTRVSPAPPLVRQRESFYSVWPMQSRSTPRKPFSLAVGRDFRQALKQSMRPVFFTTLPDEDSTTWWDMGNGVLIALPSHTYAPITSFPVHLVYVMQYWESFHAKMP